MKQINEPYENPYDQMTREDRSTVFYSKKRSDRRDQRDYQDSIARLLPVPKGSDPISRELMEKLFRGKTGKQKQAERAAKKADRVAAQKAERKLLQQKEHEAYVAKLRASLEAERQKADADAKELERLLSARELLDE